MYDGASDWAAPRAAPAKIRDTRKSFHSVEAWNVAKDWCQGATCDVPSRTHDGAHDPDGVKGWLSAVSIGQSGEGERGEDLGGSLDRTPRGDNARCESPGTGCVGDSAELLNESWIGDDHTSYQRLHL